LALNHKASNQEILGKFLITYELEGCQKAVNFLTEYYEVRKMRTVLDGKKVGKKCLGFYLKNTACFTKNGLKKRVVLHELYHHLIDTKNFEMPLRKEEMEANKYANLFFKSKKQTQKEKFFVD